MTTETAQTKKNSENNDLIIYRLDRVEASLNNLNAKFDNLNSPTRADLIDFKTNFMTALNEHQQETNERLKDKADKATVDLIKKIVFTACGIILAAVLYAALASIGIKK